MDVRADPTTSDAEIRRRHTLIEELTGIGYWEVDLKRRTLLWSTATYQLFGVDPQTFRPSLDWFDSFVHPEDLEQVHAAIYASRNLGTAYQIEHRIVRSDSTIRHVLEHGRHEYDESGTPVFFRGTVQDISATIEIRERMVRTERQAILSRVVGEVAHDFNNQLSVVSGNLDVLQIRYGDLPDAQRLLDRAQDSVATGAALTERLLAFFDHRLSSPVTIELVSTIGEFLPTLSQVVGKRVALDFRPSLDQVLCRLDKTRLETALLNAVINARDAMPGGGRIVLSITEAYVFEDLTQMVRLAVTDTGTGIPNSIRERVFDPFFTTKANHGGTGLGLPIIRDFAKESGGTVELRSAPGEGTTLSLVLPTVSEYDEHDRRPAPSLAIRETDRKIVLIEDDRNVRGFIEEGLTALGFNVASFSSPVKALGYLQRNTETASAIVCDVRLPGSIDGFAFARTARRLREDLPVVFISGYVGEQPIGEALTDTGARLIRKPFRIADLVSALDEVIPPG